MTQTILTGVPVGMEHAKAGFRYEPGPGFNKHQCEDCHEMEVWLGPEQQNLKREKPDTPVLCPLCIMSFSPLEEVRESLRTLVDESGSKLVPTTPESQ